MTNKDVGAAAAAASSASASASDDVTTEFVRLKALPFQLPSAVLLSLAMSCSRRKR